MASTADVRFAQLQQDEANALAILKQEEAQTGNHTIFNNYDTYNIINRGNKTFS